MVLQPGLPGGEIPSEPLFSKHRGFFMDEVYSCNQQESDWINMARAGDLPAFNQLVLAYQDAAFRVAQYMVSDDACAEDILQTVFLTAYCRIASFRSNNFRAWLLKMIRNACIDELRRRKRHLPLEMKSQDANCEAVGAAGWPVDTRRMPEETLIQHETREWIEQCLRQLPEPMREVIILIDIESFAYAEAADTLGIPLGTVKSRLVRARACLRELLRKARPEPEGQDTFRSQKYLVLPSQLENQAP